MEVSAGSGQQVNHVDVLVADDREDDSSDEESHRVQGPGMQADFWSRCANQFRRRLFCGTSIRQPILSHRRLVWECASEAFHASVLGSRVQGELSSRLEFALRTIFDHFAPQLFPGTATIP